MKRIVITEDIANTIKKDYEMSEHRFKSNVKYFLAQLLEDPVNTKPSEALLYHGFDRVKLLKELTNAGVLERHERISDKDKEGKWKTATMLLKYKVKRDGLDTAILKIYTKYFDNDNGKEELNEDGGGACACGGGCPGGATSCDCNAIFSTPVFPMLSRGSIIKTRKKKRKQKRSRK